jgi:ribonuclease HI
MITHCFVDGSFRPTGTAAAVVIYRDKKEVFRTVKPVAAGSSMAAECEAVILAVNLCYICNYAMPIIYSDSKTLYDQFDHRRKVKNKNLALYIYALREMEKVFPFQLRHVKRADVFIPDELCKNFLADAHQFYQQNIKDSD